MRRFFSLKEGIVKDTFIYSIGSFGSKILSFLLIPFYTFFLTKRELGEYDLLITSVSFLLPLVSLQISDSAYRWLIVVKEEGEMEKASIITNSTIVLFLCCGLFLVLAYPFFRNFEFSIYFIFLLFVNSFLILLQNFLRGLGEIKKFALNGILTTFLVVFFNIIFIYFLDFRVEGILLANCLAYTIASFMILLQIDVRKNLELKLWDFKLVKSMISYSLPLIPNLMSWWVISSSSKFIILHYLGVESNGVYAVSSRFPTILVIINSVILMPLQDKILKGEGNFDKILGKLIFWEFMIACCLGLSSPLFTKFLLPTEYFDSWELMPLLFLGIAFNTASAFIGLEYQKQKKTTMIAFSSVLGSMISIISCILLVQCIGLYGVSVAFLLGFIGVFLIRYFDIRRKKFSTKLLLSISFFVFLTVLSSFTIKMFLI